ncbi:uncharacterized protein METZ01_LOCUS92538, partial [marine metagenome]
HEDSSSCANRAVSPAIATKKHTVIFIDMSIFLILLILYAINHYIIIFIMIFTFNINLSSIQWQEIFNIIKKYEY